MAIINRIDEITETCTLFAASKLIDDHISSTFYQLERFLLKCRAAQAGTHINTGLVKLAHADLFEGTEADKRLSEIRSMLTRVATHSEFEHVHRRACEAISEFLFGIHQAVQHADKDLADVIERAYAIAAASVLNLPIHSKGV